MAELQTQGFALSALPRAPRIPAGTGAIDVKEIYDGVRQGLAAFESVRRAPASMALADAELYSKAVEAPIGTRQLLAQTEGIEQQTPLKTAILANQASPEYLAAQRQALLAKANKPLTGTAFLINRISELERGVAENPEDPLLLKDLADARGKLEEARTIAAGNVAGRETTTGMTTASREKVAAETDTRVRELAASNETMRRELDALKLESQERVAAANRAAPAKATPPQGFTALKIAQTAEAEAARAKAVLDEAKAGGDVDTITAAQADFDAVDAAAKAARKEYDLYHAERSKKRTGVDTAALASALTKKPTAGASPPVATPAPTTDEWSTVRIGDKDVRIRVKPSK